MSIQFPPGLEWWSKPELYREARRLKIQLRKSWRDLGMGLKNILGWSSYHPSERLWKSLTINIWILSGRYWKVLRLNIFIVVWRVQSSAGPWVSGWSSGVSRTIHFYLNVSSKPARVGGSERGALWPPAERRSSWMRGVFQRAAGRLFCLRKIWLYIVSLVRKKRGRNKSWWGSVPPGMTG